MPPLSAKNDEFFNLESAVGRCAGCVMTDSCQGATTSNSELLRGVATQPRAEQRVPCASWRVDPEGELMSPDDFFADQSLAPYTKRSTADSRFDLGDYGDPQYALDFASRSHACETLNSELVTTFSRTTVDPVTSKSRFKRSFNDLSRAVDHLNFLIVEPTIH